jgi:hypothetical protein
MRSIFASLRRLTLPAGATTGLRIELDGITGEIRFYDDTGAFVGLLSPEQWAIGNLDDPGARITLDPAGGLRFRSADDVLVSVLDQGGYSLRDTASGLVVAEVAPGSIRLVDSTGTDDIELTTDSAASMPNPKYVSATEEDPGNTIVAPLSSVFTTTPADDLGVVHAAAWLPDTTQAATWTPPGGYTERVDADVNANGDTLAVGVSTLAATTGAAATHTSSQSNWDKGLGTQVVVRGGGPVSPSFRAVSTLEASTVGTSITLTLAKPTGTADGDVLIAYVTMGNDGGTIPIGWTTPDGWVFLGANFILTGTGSAQSMLAVGCWAKLADGEPADYSVAITMGVGSKTFHACIVAVQDPFLVQGGAHIRIAGHPIRRLLAYNELQAASTTLCDFTDVPAGFDHLELIYSVKSDRGTDALRNIRVRFNGDTTNNYHTQLTRDGVITSILSTSRILIGATDGGNGGFESSGIINILDYGNPAERRMTLGHAQHLTGANIVDESNIGMWRDQTEAIDRVHVEVEGGVTQADVGSRAFLYGY